MGKLGPFKIYVIETFTKVVKYFIYVLYKVGGTINFSISFNIPHRAKEYRNI